MTGPRPGPPRPGPSAAGAPPAGAPHEPDGSDVAEAELTAAVAALAELAGRPPAEHVTAFERVHTAMSATLADGAADGQDAPDGVGSAGSTGGR